MSLYEPFGVGKIKEHDYWAEATDYVVPNSQLNSLKDSVSFLSAHFTILEYLDNNSSEKRPLKFAITSRYGAEFKYNECHIHEGLTLSTITYVDGYPQICLSQALRKRLRQKDLSVIRHNKSSSYAHPKIDTTRVIFEMPVLKYKEYDIQVLHQDYWLYGKFVSDYVVKKADLAQFAESSYRYTTIGSFDECMKVGDYFQMSFPEKAIPFNLQKMSLSKGYWSGNDILATSRLVEKGKEVFLSREGYRFLKENSFVILRAEKQAEADEWRRLEIVFDAEVAKW